MENYHICSCFQYNHTTTKLSERFDEKPSVTSRINKKSKFRFITPILYLRSEEDRESLVHSKISLILTKNNQENTWKTKALDLSDIMSEELFKIYCSECSIFLLNYKFNEFSRQSFNVPDLNIMEDTAKCGILLKDWKRIPLRQISPNMFEDGNKKLNEEAEDETEFNSKEIVNDSEIETHQLTDDLNPQKLGNSISNIHEEDERRDCDIRDAETNTYVTVSPDLFEEQHSRLSIDMPIAETNSAKIKKNLRKLFSEVDLSERQKENDVTPDYTIILPSKPYFHECSESQRKFSSGSVKPTNFTNSNVSEYLYISSSSDEGELNDTKKIDENGPKELNEIDSTFINSIPEEGSYALNIPDNSSSGYKDSTHLKWIPKNPLKRLSTHNYQNNSSTEVGLDIHDLPHGYINHNIGLKVISCISKLDDNVFGHNSEENDETYETNIINESCGQLKKSNEVSYTFDEKTEIHSKTESVNSKFDSASEEYLPIMKVKSVIEKVIKDSMNGHKKQCSSDVIDIGKHTSKLSPNQNTDFGDTCTVNGPNSYTNLTSFDDEKYNNESNLLENMVISGSVQRNFLTFSDSEKLDKMSVNKTLSESCKDVISLNMTEHIEAMLARSYSPINSRLSDEESKSTSNNKQAESYKRRTVSISNSSCDPQRSVNQKINVSDNIVLGNNQHESLGEKSYSIIEDIVCISDEEINYSSNITRNEGNFNRNNWIYKPESVGHLNESKSVDHLNKTPLKRFASFTVCSTPKETASFGRYKSESDITPNRKFIIETENITPMRNYAELNTPDIIKELDKYGLKPMKRKRGVNLLKHIYEATHPIVESKGQIVDKNNKVLKKVKEDKCEIVSKNWKTIVPDDLLHGFHSLELCTETIRESDLIFESQRLTKIPTCQIPLQIVWHNFLVQNPEIRKNILLYEPLQVDIVNKMLKEEGFKFNLQDIITFLDRKCITIKVPQNNNRKN